MDEKILILGAGGQIGTELVEALRSQHGKENVIASDLKEEEDTHLEGPYEMINVLDKEKTSQVIGDLGITQIYNLAALLSATSEERPEFAWKINMVGLFNTLNLAVEHKLNKVFWPSSIAVFGPDTPKQNTPQYAVANPNTVYGISKLAGEGWIEWYNRKHGIDVRSIRYPGLISHKAEPGGGTTDYAVAIFYEALKNGNYTCFLKEDTELPMMFMEDAIRGTIELMDAPAEKLSIHSGYNFTSCSFTPAMLAEEIKKYLPDFSIAYEPDFRQSIADTWPCTIDDSQARKDWGWKHKFGMEEMAKVMIEAIAKKLGVELLHKVNS